MLHTITTLLLLLCHVVSTTIPCNLPCNNPLPGIAFDIDGVVRQGNRPCLEGLEAIVTMQEKKWPFIFLTNGGAGRTEEEYALKLTKMFMSSDVRTCTGTYDPSPAAALADRAAALPLQKKLNPLKGSQFVLAYTPLSEIESMKQQRILAVGASGVERVARSYGYTNVLHANEYARRHPEQSPWMTRWVSETPPGCPGLFGDENDLHGDGPFDHSYEEMDAIFVMSDPNFFGKAYFERYYFSL
jgi:ribonucleotide monophosphatase NagD (HAD superfamily)